MAKPKRSPDDDFVRINIEIERETLRQLRSRHPEYGFLSRLVRHLLKLYLMVPPKA